MKIASTIEVSKHIKSEGTDQTDEIWIKQPNIIECFGITTIMLMMLLFFSLIQKTIEMKSLELQFSIFRI